MTITDHDHPIDPLRVAHARRTGCPALEDASPAHQPALA